MVTVPRIKSFYNVNLDKILESSYFKDLKDSKHTMHVSAFEVTGIKTKKMHKIKDKIKKFEDDLNILYSDLYEANAYPDLTTYFIMSRKPPDNFSKNLKKSNISTEGKYGLDYLLYLKMLDYKGKPLKGEEFEIAIEDKLHSVLDLYGRRAILGRRIHVSDLFENGLIVYNMNKCNGSNKEFNSEIDLIVISEFNLEVKTMEELYLSNPVQKKIMGDKLFFEEVLDSFRP